MNNVSFSPEKLSREIEEALTEKYLSTLFDLDNESFNNLINFSSIPFELTTKTYFCPIFLIIDNENCYPLFFLQSVITKKNNHTLLSRRTKLPIFNKLALYHLNKLNIETTDYSRITDLNSYLLSLEGNIQIAGMSNNVKFVKKLNFYDEECLFLNKIFPLIDDYMKGKHIEQKYLGLISQIKNSNIDAKINDETRDELFSDYKKVALRLKYYQGSKLYFNDTNIICDFILYLVSQNLPEGEPLLFVVNTDKEKDGLKQLFIDNNLKDFLLDFNELSPSLLNEEIAYEGLTLEERDSIKKFSEDEKEYLSLINERNHAYSNPRDIYTSQIIDDVITTQNKNIVPLNLDIIDYSFEEFKKDYQFLNTIDTLSTLKNINTKEHIYYGLSVTDKRRNYDELNLELIKILNSLNAFQKLLDEKNITDFDNNKIKSCKQFEEYGKEINILSSYNGFPKKYFRIVQEEQVLKNLDDIKKLFQAISSTKLLIINICTEKIFELDLKRILKDLNSKFIFTRIRAKKKLLSYFNVKNQKELFNSLVKLLKAYISYVDLMKKNIQKYKDEFGDSIETMNGVIEIESNIKHIYIFRERESVHPNFSMNNPLVKKCYRERSIRNHVIEIYRELNKQYQILKSHLNKFIGFFLDADYNYFTMSFTELSKLFSRILKGSYKEFSDYAIYRNGLNNTSSLFNVNLLAFEKKNQKLSEFRYLFVYSLASAIYKRGRKRFRPHLKAYEQVKSSYLSTLDQKNDLQTHHLYNSIVRKIKITQDTPLYQIEHHELSTQFNSREIDYNFYKRLYKHLAVNYLICVCTADELININSDIANKVVIFDSTKQSFAGLLVEILSGSHLLFIENIKDIDNRTQGYPDLAFSSSSYLSLFNFNSLPKSFYQKLNETFNQFGFNIKSTSFFPLTIYNNRDEIVGTILPDILIPNNKEMQVRSEFRKFIKSIYHIPVLIISIFSFLINPKETISSIINRISDDDYDIENENN